MASWSLGAAPADRRERAPAEAREAGRAGSTGRQAWQTQAGRRGFAAEAAGGGGGGGGKDKDEGARPADGAKVSTGPMKAAVRRAAERRAREGEDGAVRVGYGEGARASALSRAQGQVYGAFVFSSMNNTHIAVTTEDGSHRFASGSAGTCGFKGCRRGTSYAAQVVGEEVARKASKMGIERVVVSLRGVGFGKESATRGLIKGGLEVVGIRETTRRPFNGCRPPRKRRV